MNDIRTQISSMSTKEIEDKLNKGEFNGPSVEFAYKTLTTRYKKPHWSQTPTFILVLIGTIVGVVSFYLNHVQLSDNKATQSSQMVNEVENVTSRSSSKKK